MRKIGEPPVIFQNQLVDKSINQIKSYFENNGYFTASIDKEIKYQLYDVKLAAINNNNHEQTVLTHLLLFSRDIVVL